MKFTSLSLVAAALVSSTTSAFMLQQTPTSSTSSITALEAGRRPFISGNWKLNPQTRQEAIDLANGISSAVTSDSPDSDVALFVPYVFIETAMDAVNGKIQIGAEVCDMKNKNAIHGLQWVVVIRTDPYLCVNLDDSWMIY